MTTDEHTSKEIAELKRRVMRMEQTAPGRLPTEWIDVVLDGPPGPEAGRFVEVEDQHGHSISVGRWVEPEEGTELWRLRITVDDLKPRRATSDGWREAINHLVLRVARLEAERGLLEADLNPGERAAEGFNRVVADRLLSKVPQLGERVARLEAVRELVDPNPMYRGRRPCGCIVELGASCPHFTPQVLDVKTATLDDLDKLGRPRISPQSSLDDIGPAELAAEMRKQAATAPSFANIGKSPGFQQVATDGLMRAFVRTDAYLKQLLGPEEYEVVQRRLLGGPRITSAPEATPAAAPPDTQVLSEEAAIQLLRSILDERATPDYEATIVRTDRVDVLVGGRTYLLRGVGAVTAYELIRKARPARSQGGTLTFLVEMLASHRLEIRLPDDVVPTDPREADLQEAAQTIDQLRESREEYRRNLCAVLGLDADAHGSDWESLVIQVDGLQRAWAVRATTRAELDAVADVLDKAGPVITGVSHRAADRAQAMLNGWTVARALIQDANKRLCQATSITADTATLAFAVETVIARLSEARAWDLEARRLLASAREEFEAGQKWIAELQDKLTAADRRVAALEEHNREMFQGVLTALHRPSGREGWKDLIGAIGMQYDRLSHLERQFIDIGTAHWDGVKLYREAGGVVPDDLPKVHAKLVGWLLTRLEDEKRERASLVANIEHVTNRTIEALQGDLEASRAAREKELDELETLRRRHNEVIPQRDAALAALASIAYMLHVERGEHVGQTRDRIVAKLDELLAPPSQPPKHNDLARRIRESDFIQGLEDRQGDHDWAREQTDGDLLDRVFKRLNHADQLETELGGIMGLLHGTDGDTTTPKERLAAALEQAKAKGRREADVERASLVAKLALVREALGATLQPDGTDDVVDKARASASRGVPEILDRELEWFSVAEAIAIRLGIPSEGTPGVAREAILVAIAKLQKGADPVSVSAVLTSGTDPGRFAQGLADILESDRRLASGLAPLTEHVGTVDAKLGALLPPLAKLPRPPALLASEQILREVITAALASGPSPADVFEVRHRLAGAETPPRTELHVFAGKGPMTATTQVLAFVELGELWIIALNGLSGYVRLSNARDTLRWPERIRAALDRK